MKKNELFTIVTALIFGSMVIGWTLLPRSVAVEPPTDLTGQPTLGDPDAPLHLILFEDFKCPSCKRYELSTFEALKRDFIDVGKAKLTFVNYPFLAPDSVQAALAAECAFEQGRFWKYKTALFQAQGSESLAWADEATLTGVAASQGLDLDSFRSCLKSPEAQAEVKRDLALVARSGVASTPTTIVGNRAVVGAGYGNLKRVIRSEAR